MDINAVLDDKQVRQFIDEVIRTNVRRVLEEDYGITRGTGIVTSQSGTVTAVSGENITVRLLGDEASNTNIFKNRSNTSTINVNDIATVFKIGNDSLSNAFVMITN